MPPNQFAQVTSCTPGVLLIPSPWLVGIEKGAEGGKEEEGDGQAAEGQRGPALAGPRALEDEADVFHDALPDRPASLIGSSRSVPPACPFRGAGDATRARRRAGRASPSR